MRMVGSSHYLSSPKEYVTSHKNVACHALVSPKKRSPLRTIFPQGISDDL